MNLKERRAQRVSQAEGGVSEEAMQADGQSGVDPKSDFGGDELMQDAEPMGPEEGPSRPADSIWIKAGVIIQGGLAVVVLCGILLCYFALDDIHESANATAQTVKETALYNEHAVQRALERAWIAPLEIDSPFTVGSPLSINIKILNSGKTFAKKCKVYGYCEILPSPKLPDMSGLAVTPTKTQDANAMFIAPGQQASLARGSLRGVISQDTYNDIQAGKSRVFLVGRVSYDDIFNKHHWIEYCYLFNPKTSIWAEAGNSATDDTETVVKAK